MNYSEYSWKLISYFMRLCEYFIKFRITIGPKVYKKDTGTHSNTETVSNPNEKLITINKTGSFV